MLNICFLFLFVNIVNLFPLVVVVVVVAVVDIRRLDNSLMAYADLILN